MAERRIQPVKLRPSAEADLDFVLRLEGDPENSPYVGSWTRAQHRGAIAAADSEHWIIEAPPRPGPVGYLIALDQRDAGRGLHLKRMVVGEKSRGFGRAALSAFLVHAFGELGATCVWLDVLTHNRRAQAAYRAAGFRVRSLTPPELADWGASVGGFDEDSLVMVCEAPE